jgi:hypothetical protein
LEKALDKLFLKFGEDEEEDAALLKVAKLYLKERAEREQREALLTAQIQMNASRGVVRGRSPTVEQETTPEPTDPEEEEFITFVEQYYGTNLSQEEIAALRTIYELQRLQQEIQQYDLDFWQSIRQLLEDYGAGRLTDDELEWLESLVLGGDIDAAYRQYEDEMRERLDRVYPAQENLLGVLQEQEVNVTAMLDIYYQAFQNAFNITIQGLDWQGSYVTNAGVYDPVEIATAFQTLNNYRIGADQMAQWLVSTFSTELAGLDPFAAFRLVMGELVIMRTDQEPLGATDGSEGFTGDHVIYDRFDADALEARAQRADGTALPMSSQTFLHELAHAFVNSSGFGEFDDSPLYTSITPTIVAEMGDVVDGSGQGEGLGLNELMANFIEVIASGRVVDWNDPELRQVRQQLGIMLVRNVLRNSQPDSVAGLIGGTITVADPSTPQTFIQASPSGDSLPNPIGTDEITVLGRSNDRSMLYVAVDRGGYYDYGWIPAESIPNIDIESLNAIDDNVMESFGVSEGRLTTGG